MTVLVLSSVPPRLKGELTRWMIELSAGVFVGQPSARVLESLWDLCVEDIGDGWAILARSAANEQGYTLRMLGDARRELVDYDGLTLVRVHKESRSHP